MDNYTSFIFQGEGNKVDTMPFLNRKKHVRTTNYVLVTDIIQLRFFK
jgi:hypothetical protein